MAVRRGNVFRLPVPPKLLESLTDGPENARILNDHLNTMTMILNQALQSLQNRQNTVQQVQAKTPPTVTGLTVTGKQGLFHLTWNRIENTDGYVIVQSADSAMGQLLNRYNIPDGDQVAHQIPIGNVAVTHSFQVYAYQGQKYSEPSPIVTGTTLTYTTPEAAPPNPAIPPRHPKLAPVRSGPNL